ncbi:unnamed protein product [Cladocopium goreaui]|uniref:Uncharacterized protein n=1 Tax=Cladocopium goreaui TaxID=2562237 RepID=A0A9P1G973_9DINO|nr:unnamed protein product [Cladocopium goreaui]
MQSMPMSFGRWQTQDVELNPSEENTFPFAPSRTLGDTNLSCRLCCCWAGCFPTGSAFSAVAELYLDLIFFVISAVSCHGISKLTHDLNSEPTFRKVYWKSSWRSIQNPPIFVESILESMIQTSGLCRAHLAVWPRVEEATSLACGADRKGSFGVTSDSSLQSSAIGQRISSTFLQILN